MKDIEIKYKIYQYDTMLKFWQLLHIAYTEEVAIKYANFWGNHTIVEKHEGKHEYSIIYVTGE